MHLYKLKNLFAPWILLIDLQIFINKSTVFLYYDV